MSAAEEQRFLHAYYERQIQRCQKVALEGLYDQTGWTFVERSKDVDIFSRPDPTSHLLCFKGVAVIAAPARIIHEVFSSFGHRRGWDAALSEARMVARHDSQTQIQHLAFKAAWPTQPRDFCLMTRTAIAEDRSIFLFSTSIEHKDCPSQSTHVRGDLFVGAVHIRPLDAHRSQCVYLVALDAKSGMASDSDSSTGSWITNKINHVQPLILSDVSKYIAANPHLFQGSAANEVVSNVSDAAVLSSVRVDESQSASQFSSAAQEHYAAKLDALAPMLERELAADSGEHEGDFVELTDAEAESDTALQAQRERNARNGWSFHSRQRDVDIYTKIEGSVVYNKGVGLVRASVPLLRYVFSDPLNRRAWDDTFNGGRLIDAGRAVGTKDNISVSYLAFNAPWPVTPRDFCLASRVAIGATDKSASLVSVSVEHPDCPPVRNRIRAEMHCGAALIVPLRPSASDSSQTCRVTFLLSMDPRGNVPEFVSNANNVRQPLCIDAIRTYIKANPGLSDIAHEVMTKEAAAAVASAASQLFSPLKEGVPVKSSPAPAAAAPRAAPAAPAAVTQSSAVPKTASHPKLDEYNRKLDLVMTRLASECDLSPANPKSQPKLGAGWTFNSNQEDVDIWTKAEGETNMCCGSTILNFPALMVHAVLTDLKNRKQWDEMLDTATSLERLDESTGIVINHFALKSVMFISARDTVAVARTQHRADGSIVLLSTSLDGHPKAPKPDSGGFVRADLKFACTLLTPLDAQSCRATYLLASDPRGSIPNWAVALANTKQPLMLAAIRKVITKSRAELEKQMPEFERVKQQILSLSSVIKSSSSSSATAVAAPASGSAAASDSNGMRDGKPIPYFEDLQRALSLVEDAVGVGATGWEFNSRQQEVDIYTKSDGKCNLSKGEGVISAPLALVLYVFSTLAGRHEWDEMYDNGRELGVVDEALTISAAYLKFKAPWPVTPREMVVAGRTVTKDDGSVWLISTSVEHADAPVDTGNASVIRAQLLFGGTVLYPIDSQSCRVVCVSSSDPKGSLPTWAVNAANVKQPLCIAAVRSHLRKNGARLQTEQQKSAKQTTQTSSATPVANDNVRAGEMLGVKICDWAVGAEFSETVGRFMKGAVWSAAFRNTISTVVSASGVGSGTGSCDEGAVVNMVRTGADSVGRPLVGLLAIRVREAKKEASVNPSLSAPSPWNSTNSLYAKVQLDQCERTTCTAPVSSKERNKASSFDSAATQPSQIQFALPVFDLSSRVRISLYSRPANNKAHHLLGEVFCPLSDLLDQRARDGWYSLIGGSPDESDGDSNDIKLRPILRLQTRLIYSEFVDSLVAGAQSAALVGAERPKSSTSIDEGVLTEASVQQMAPYTPEKLVANAYRLSNAAHSTLSSLSFLLRVLNWTSPPLTAACVLLVLACCFYPALTPVVLALLMVAVVFVHYTQSKFKRLFDSTERGLRVQLEQRDRVSSVVDMLAAQQPSPDTQVLLRHLQHHSGRLAEWLEPPPSTTASSDSSDWAAVTAVLWRALLLVLLAVLVPVKWIAAAALIVCFAWNAKPVVVLRRAWTAVRVYSARSQERHSLK